MLSAKTSILMASVLALVATGRPIGQAIQLSALSAPSTAQSVFHFNPLNTRDVRTLNVARPGPHGLEARSGRRSGNHPIVSFGGVPSDPRISVVSGSQVPFDNRFVAVSSTYGSVSAVPGLKGAVVGATKDGVPMPVGDFQKATYQQAHKNLERVNRVLEHQQSAWEAAHADSIARGKYLVQHANAVARASSSNALRPRGRSRPTKPPKTGDARRAKPHGKSPANQRAGKSSGARWV